MPRLMMAATGGITQATADARYLKLDCSNDPLTDNLEIQGSATLINVKASSGTGNGFYSQSGPLVGNYGTASLYSQWDDVADDWLAVLEGTKVGYQNATFRVGRIAGSKAADLSGDLLPSTDDAWSQGNVSQGWKQSHFPRATANTAGPRTDFRGNVIADSDGDIFFGSDPAAPGYYAQRAVKANSTSTDYTEDATNFFQGKWGSGASPAYPYLDIMYTCGGANGAVGGYLLGEDGTTYIRNGTVTMGYYVAGLGGGGGLLLGARIYGCGTLLDHDETNARFVIRVMSNSSKTAQQINEIALAGTRLTSFVPVTSAAVAMGNATHQWKSLSLSGGVGFYGTAVTTQGSVSGSRAGNAALASLLTILAGYGLIVDGSSA